MKSIEVKIGHEFGSWTVSSPLIDKKPNGSYCHEVICKCGRKAIRNHAELNNGRSTRCKSCSNFKHGMSHTSLHTTWGGMKQRCLDENLEGYKNYGGRGICICYEWKNNFILFKEWALNNGWEKGLEIDRIDNNGDYEPSNCRFVTRLVNAQNKRNTVNLTMYGETKSVSAWARDKRISKERRLISSLKSKGFSDEYCLTAKRR